MDPVGPQSLPEITCHVFGHFQQLGFPVHVGNKFIFEADGRMENVIINFFTPGVLPSGAQRGLCSNYALWKAVEILVYGS